MLETAELSRKLSVGQLVRLRIHFVMLPKRSCVLTALLSKEMYVHITISPLAAM
jgi:hypothetical protein